MKPENKRIGLIGVGLLGGAIAERLLQHGFVVSGFDLDRGRLDALDAMGGKACRDAVDVFTACKTVLLSLPTSEIVCELLSQDVTGVSGSLTAGCHRPECVHDKINCLRPAVVTPATIRSAEAAGGNRPYLTEKPGKAGVV